MKEAEENMYLNEDDIIDMNIEDLTEIQGGIEDDEAIQSRSCGLGCFIGSGSGTL